MKEKDSLKKIGHITPEAYPQMNYENIGVWVEVFTAGTAKISR
ncbi:MAG: hypothetical protein WBB23_23040 [Desulforhopalus sp.]